MMYAFNLFAVALILFLLFSYRDSIKAKLGFKHTDQTTLEQSVSTLEAELQNTADAIVHRLAQEQQRMELILQKASERIAELELLLRQAEYKEYKLESTREECEKYQPIESRETKNSVFERILEQEIRSEDPRIRIVCEMADQGMEIHEISQATGIDYSEIRLLINIGRRQAVRPASRQA
jgi:TolA-binding protein